MIIVICFTLPFLLYGLEAHSLNKITTKRLELVEHVEVFSFN